jgi:hypothetical protein
VTIQRPLQKLFLGLPRENMLSREKLEKYKKDEMMECMRESVDVLMMEKKYNANAHAK